MNTYDLWLTSKSKVDFPVFEKRRETRRRQLDAFMNEIERKAELANLVRNGYITMADAADHDYTVRFMGIDIMPAIKA